MASHSKGGEHVSEVFHTKVFPLKREGKEKEKKMVKELRHILDF